jgi:hypothetical protein
VRETGRPRAPLATRVIGLVLLLACSIGLYLPDGHAMNSSIAWSVKVKNVITSEVRTFEPAPDMKFIFPRMGAWICVLETETVQQYPVPGGTAEVFEYVSRQLLCRFEMNEEGHARATVSRRVVLNHGTNLQTDSLQIVDGTRSDGTRGDGTPGGEGVDSWQLIITAKRVGA